MNCYVTRDMFLRSYIFFRHKLYDPLFYSQLHVTHRLTLDSHSKRCYPVDAPVLILSSIHFPQFLCVILICLFLTHKFSLIKYDSVPWNRTWILNFKEKRYSVRIHNVIIFVSYGNSSISLDKRYVDFMKFIE